MTKRRRPAADVSCSSRGQTQCARCPLSAASVFHSLGCEECPQEESFPATRQDNEMKSRRAMRHLAWVSAAMLLALAPAAAQPVADFYRGKTISLYVGFPPGGGYDLYARAVAPHFSRHIPGQPTIVIKSMLGGSGIRAAGYMTAITPQDGTSLGLFLDTTTLGKMLGGPGDFDPVKLVWIEVAGAAQHFS